MPPTYKANNPEAVTAAAAVLAAGGIVLYPTDTVYGLGADARKAAALARLYKLKGRPDGKPVSVLVADFGAATALGMLNHNATLLAQKFLPGGLTLVIPLKDSAALCTHSEQTTVGIRMIAHPFCQALATMTAFPITATSANRSGEPTPTTVTAILAQFGDRANMIDLVIDDGPCDGRIPSTVVDTTTSPPTLRRAGAVPWDNILATLENAQTRATTN